VLLLASAYIFAALTGHIWVLLTLITLPMAFLLSKEVLQGATESQLIPLLGRTGKLQLLFALIFAASLAL